MSLNTPTSSIVDAPVVAEHRSPHNYSNLNRKDFPEGFLFGTATSAYQVEGASAIGGKGISVWDDFTSRYPWKISDGSNGVVACDMYNKFEEDIVRMKKLGFDVFRFSIAWTRILPGGKLTAGINREGIDYYNRLINTILFHGMQPFVTLFHWDLPYVLLKEYGGFLSKDIVTDFHNYVKICFWEFGDRVKYWTTINEPYQYTYNGYIDGSCPPGISTEPPNNSLEKLPMNDTKIDIFKAPYTVARHLLLCHAEAVHLYRKEFQAIQEGKIGIVLDSQWYVPWRQHLEEDRIAARRVLDFAVGWFLEPVLHGRYPESMVKIVRPNHLEPFSLLETEMLQNSVDFVGINYYTSSYAEDDPYSGGHGYNADMKVKTHTKDIHGKLIGEQNVEEWMPKVPWGLYELMVHLKRMYPNMPPIYITETGCPDKNDPKLTPEEACVDLQRCKYHHQHLYYLLKAIHEEKVDVRGYIVWSWCDNFEWSRGYTLRFGITYVDFINHQTRHMKDSAMWFAKFLHNKNNPFLSSLKRPAIEGDIENVENEPFKRLRST